MPRQCQHTPIILTYPANPYIARQSQHRSSSQHAPSIPTYPVSPNVPQQIQHTPSIPTYPVHSNIPQQSQHAPSIGPAAWAPQSSPSPFGLIISAIVHRLSSSAPTAQNTTSPYLGSSVSWMIASVHIRWTILQYLLLRWQTLICRRL